MPVADPSFIWQEAIAAFAVISIVAFLVTWVVTDLGTCREHPTWRSSCSRRLPSRAATSHGRARPSPLLSASPTRSGHPPRPRQWTFFDVDVDVGRHRGATASAERRRRPMLVRTAGWIPRAR